MVQQLNCRQHEKGPDMLCGSQQQPPPRSLLTPRPSIHEVLHMLSSTNAAFLPWQSTVSLPSKLACACPSNAAKLRPHTLVLPAGSARVNCSNIWPQRLLWSAWDSERALSPTRYFVIAPSARCVGRAVPSALCTCDWFAICDAVRRHARRPAMPACPELPGRLCVAKLLAPAMDTSRRHGHNILPIL